MFAAHQLKSQTNGLKPFEWNNSGKISLEQLKIKESSKDIYENKTGATSTLLNTNQFFFFIVLVFVEIKCIKNNEILNSIMNNPKLRIGHKTCRKKNSKATNYT